MKQIIIIIVCAGILAGCSSDFRFEPYTLRATGGIPQDGSPAFNQGWRDGCDSGMAAFGNYTYKLIYDFRKDPKQIRNPEYIAAWNAAYSSCRWYTNTWLRPPGGNNFLF